MNNTARQIHRRRAAILSVTGLLAILFAVIWGAGIASAQSAPSVLVTAINYEDSTLIIQANANDTEVYFSDSKGKVWDTIPGVMGSDKKIILDISWIPVSTKYTLKLKGDYSTTVTTIVIPKQATNFKASYNKVKQTVNFTNQGSRTVEWRKKDSYIWNTVNTNTFASELELLCTQGSTLCLRLAPVNGSYVNGVFSAGERPSKEITMTIPKKTNAPTVTINGSSFLIPATKNMAYRTVYSNGTTSAWTTLTSAKNLLLSEIAQSALYVDDKTVQSAVTLQFMKMATSSSQMSHITTVTVPVQEAAPQEDANGISIGYTSATTLELIVKAASTAKPFEYTIIKPDTTLNYQKASWTSITSQSPVQITSTTAPAGSHIYIRKKTIAATATVKFALASKELDITGSAGVDYPDAAKMSGLTTLITTAGVCNTSNSSGNLSFTLYSPTKTTVSSLSFRDQYGSTKGLVAVKSTVALNSRSTSEADKYIITTKITSTDKLDTITDTALYADITMENKDTIASTTSNGVMLYLYPAAKVNNSDHKTYKSDFERILYSTESNDSKSFTFQLDFGNMKVPSLSSAGTMTDADMKVTGLSFDSYTLKEDTDYSIVYSSYVNDEQKTIRTAAITVYVSQFEKASAITTLNSSVPVIISLNDGEKLNNVITIKLTETATLTNTPIAWSIMEGSLVETQKSTVTNEDKTTSVIEEEVVTFALDLEVFSKTYDVSISDVTWGGTSILKSASMSAGKVVIYLSNPKINKLTTASTTTNNVVIILSNGYQIKSGCKLTIINAD